MMVRSMPFRLVLDTNILVRGLLNNRSASGQILHACESREFLPLLSRSVLAEYHAILFDSELHKLHPILKNRRTKSLLERLAYIADVIRVEKHLPFPRDPRDAKFLELAIAGHATHLLTNDKDLLDLAHGRDDTAKRIRRKLPALVIINSEDFIQRYRFKG